ncbi:sigma-70 family RNA polymerase sigma factor [Myceligenerans cantabricum]
MSRRVPSADPELATSRGLERLCREIVVRGAVDRPVDYWHHAAIDAAAEPSCPPGLGAGRAPEATRTVVVREQAPRPVERAAPDAEGRELPPSITPTARTIDFDHLRAAMSRLPEREQQILWDRHVNDQPVGEIAENIGVLPYAARRQLRRAENKLASGFADAHAKISEQAECRTTRSAMHDYIRHRLLPGRRRELEDHLIVCAECTRAFTDVRESYWMLRAAAPVLLLGTMITTNGPSAVGAAVSTATGVTTGMAAGAALGSTGTSAVSSTVASLVAKSAVVARSITFDPTALVATIVGAMVATGAATGVAIRNDMVSFGDPIVASEVTRLDDVPAAPSPEATSGSGTTPSAAPESAAGGATAPDGAPSAGSSENDGALSAGGEGAGVSGDLDLGDAVDIGAGAGVEASDDRVTVTVQARAKGELLHLLYEIVPGEDTEVLNITLDDGTGIVAQVGDTYYLIPAGGLLATSEVQAKVTVLGPEGTEVGLQAMDERSARQRGFGGLTDLTRKILGDEKASGSPDSWIPREGTEDFWSQEDAEDFWSRFEAGKEFWGSHEGGEGSGSSGDSWGSDGSEDSWGSGDFWGSERSEGSRDSQDSWDSWDSHEAQRLEDRFRHHD